MPIAGCKEPKQVVLHCHCGETFWHLMRDETSAFEQIYGIQIVLHPILPSKTDQPAAENESTQTRRTSIPWRNRPKVRDALDPSEVTLDPVVSHLISSFSRDGRGDLFLTDSILQIERLEDSSLVTHRYPICYLSMGMLVPLGNPLKIRSVKDIFDKKLKVGIMAPSKDGMGLTALELLTADAGDVSEEIRETLIRMYDRQAELLDALEKGEVSAVLAWDAIRTDDYLKRKYADEYAELYKKQIVRAKRANTVDVINGVLDDMFDTILVDKKFAERVELTGQTRTVEVPLISLGCSLHDRHNRRFADFLISPQGREIMRKHGFVTK